MSAAELTHAFGGQRVGHVWMARCPAHNNRTPSLSIGEGNDGKLLFYCHAGCGQAQVIVALQHPVLWSADLQRRHFVRARSVRSRPEAALDKIINEGEQL